MILFIFGDSIAQGCWDSRGGWADRIKSAIHKQEIESNLQNYHEVFNLGVDGNTCEDILNRLQNETDSRIWPDTENAFIFAIGTNDTLHRNKKEFESSPGKFESNLSSIVKISKKFSTKIMFVDLLPVVDALTNPLKYSTTGKCYTNQRINLFNNTLYRFCEKNKIKCLKVHDVYSSRKYQDLLIDGVHPNDSGHELIYSQVLPEVKKMLNL